MKNLISFFVISVFLLSCGKDKKSSNYSPLNSDQKLAFNEFVTSTGNTVVAPRRLHSKRILGALSDLRQLNVTQQQMSQQLEKSNCDISESKSEPSHSNFAPGTSGYYKLKMTGSSCPAQLDTAFDYSINSTSAEANFFAKYSITDSQYKGLNDVTAFDIKGKGSLSGSQNSSEGSATVTGTIQSTRHGQVGVELTAEGKGGKTDGEGLAILAFKFKDFTAEIRAVYEVKNRVQTVEYFLNGQKMTEREIQDYFAKL